MSINLENIPGIGPKTIDKLNRLGVKQGQDLIYHFPHRYLDFRHSTDIAKIQEKQNFTLKGQITQLKNIYTRTGKNIQTATLVDKTGQINLIWFNQPYLLKTLKEGQLQQFAGAVSLYQNKPCLINPVFGQYHTGKIVAIYPETAGLTSNWFRKTIQNSFPSLISDIKEPLSATIISRFKLMPLTIALRQIHFPDNPKKLHQAQTRLKLAEILNLQILSYRQKQAWQKLKPQIQLKYTSDIKKKIKNLIDGLPFSLTPSQKKVWSEIRKDLLSSCQPTNRLLQGDVGSGKTIIGLLACYLTSLNHSLSLFVVPTEILARQHFQTFKKILKNTKTPLKLLTAKSKITWEKISPNTIIIATHAAIYQKNKIKQKVALLIVDEQHKFGVKQRNFLQQTRSSP
ncbi:DEAD/DEAH box helicase, partial [Patescibacteria group bacterium]|nr:DEAD/DEAH box helicase [Patescibacteria group bacterium]